MCQDPNCKYIELAEGQYTKTATHYGISNETGNYYVLWVDTWEVDVVMDYAGNLVKVCNKKPDIFRPKNKTRKIKHNRVVKLF